MTKHLYRMVMLIIIGSTPLHLSFRGKIKITRAHNFAKWDLKSSALVGMTMKATLVWRFEI